jgi:dTDP-4-dehydrorhamnose 3,5-epimerase
VKLRRTSLEGAWILELELQEDERGFFARTYCERIFADHGLNTHWQQCNLTRTARRGTLRGLHYQAEPKPEIKMIRCSAGVVLDVIVDVRAGSPTFGRWEAFELTAKNHLQLYVPAGFAHGFQCLEDGSELFYQMSEFYYPELARGVRWNDPTLKIIWPIPDPVLSDRDRNLPLLTFKP